MNDLLAILSGTAGFCIGMATIWFFGKSQTSSIQRATDTEIAKIRDTSRQQIEQLKKAAEIEGKEKALEQRHEAETYAQEKNEEIKAREKHLADLELEIDESRRAIRKIESDISRREKKLVAREQTADELLTKTTQAQAMARQRLEEIAKMDTESAQKALVEELTKEVRGRTAEEIQRIEEEAKKTCDEISKTIIATAIQRHASEFVTERTVTVVPLPSDDMKGRLIGREGRNIRALEAAAGIDLIIDDTSGVITISCFNPVRREIARNAILKLVADGRIHPTRIEEAVRESRLQIEDIAKQAGEQAVFDLGLHKMHPELILQLGRLKFRQSYAQNVLEHSIEVGFIAGLVAAEVGASVKTARRAGLLHDIGKAVDHEQEGSHSTVGALFARRHGENSKICQAIERHHGSPAPKTILDYIVSSANTLSAARPGARRELLASYIRRLEDIEESIQPLTGVSRVFAVQMGRQIRVMVENDKVDDIAAQMLGKDIAHRLETEATYAGELEVVVIRETRASEYAR